jgi:pyruvoyl-dependent arginine decarboxylase (PvlArgDC)
VAGFAKAYNLTFDYVLYKISYANLIMYSSVLPRYDSKEQALDGDDPETIEKLKRL